MGLGLGAAGTRWEHSHKSMVGASLGQPYFYILASGSNGERTVDVVSISGLVVYVVRRRAGTRGLVNVSHDRRMGELLPLELIVGFWW